MSIKLFDSRQMREWDQATLAAGVASIDLMERASLAMADRLTELLDLDARILILAGPGNNGGDALALARILSDRSFEISATVLVQEQGKALSPDAAINASRVLFQAIHGEVDLRLLHEAIADSTVLIDGLFGSGFQGEMQGIYAEVVAIINASALPVISIDIPSGMHADRAGDAELAIRADHVLTLQTPKRAFLLPGSQEFMNGFERVDIQLDEEFHQHTACAFYYLLEEDIQLPFRKKFDHKGRFGPALIIAGSAEMMGAAQLCCSGALQAGVGVLHAAIPSQGAVSFQVALPEVILKLRSTQEEGGADWELDRFKAIACGPGIGNSEATQGLLLQLLEQASSPLVIDADALNMIAHHAWHDRIPAGTIITPHLKEFERLFGAVAADWDRILLQQQKSVEMGIIIVLKGAHTSISLPDGTVYFNSTGNPLMATPGSGDVLCGLILALLAQGYSPRDAALSGVFLHGEAGDRAAEGKWAIRSSDIAAEIGKW